MFMVFFSLILFSFFLFFPFYYLKLYGTNALSVWNELKSRRKLFETYARRNDFNPLVPENWYSIDAKSLVSDKVISIANFNGGGGRGRCQMCEGGEEDVTNDIPRDSSMSSCTTRTA